jgi:tetratricopeptide (TPR) repeat protein
MKLWPNRRRLRLWLVLLLVVFGWALTGWVGLGDAETQFARILIADGRLKRLREGTSAWDKLYVQWQKRRVEVGYQQFLRRHPDHARAMVAYGCYLYEEDHEPEAVKLWQRAVATDPGLAVAHNNLGEHFSHHGHADAALQYFDKARQLAPIVAMYHYNWATVCSLFRRDAERVYGWDEDEIFRQSLVAFRWARELAPQNYTFANAYACTFLLMRHPDWDEAHAAWLYCLGLPTEEAERQFNYGRLSRVCMHLGRVDEAQQWIDRMTDGQVSSMREALRHKLTAQRPVMAVSAVAAAATPAP